MKWNAPSFCWQGNDRVTFRLQPGDRVELVFSCGIAPKSADGFRCEDPSGLIAWAAADRGVVTVEPETDLVAMLAAITDLVSRWKHQTGTGHG